MRDAQEQGSLEVPSHLRNAPTRLMRELGHGEGYRYAHDEPEAFAAGENYFPEGMAAKRYYHPVSRGLEQRIAERLAYLRGLSGKAAAGRGEAAVPNDE
jgi:putative ATPase